MSTSRNSKHSLHHTCDQLFIVEFCLLWQIKFGFKPSYYYTIHPIQSNLFTYSLRCNICLRRHYFGFTKRKTVIWIVMEQLVKRQFKWSRICGKPQVCNTAQTPNWLNWQIDYSKLEVYIKTYVLVSLGLSLGVSTCIFFGCKGSWTTADESHILGI